VKRTYAFLLAAPFLALAQVPFFVGNPVAAAGLTIGEVYPVGSVYLSITSTNPGTLFGVGTWVQIGQGRALVGQDGTDTDWDVAEETRGAKTVASAGSNSAPTFTGSALGTHLHGTGTYAASAHAGAAVADHGSHTHTYTDVLNHTHTVTVTDGGHSHATPSQTATTGSATSYEHGAIDTSSTEANEGETTASATTGITASTANPGGGVAGGTTAGPGATLTHSVTQPSAHSLSGSSEAVSGGTPAGSVSAATFTGSPTSVVQPSFVVYVWKRTA
jgi:hypothetical protein